ncbi:MAG: hypothetical protein Kow00121_65360 [Elainellaceae cyanobacterium]
MNSQRKALFIKVATWFMAEVVLNLVGLDNLADYSEFLFDNHLEAIAARPEVVAMLTIDHCHIPSISA